MVQITFSAILQSLRFKRGKSSTHVHPACSAATEHKKQSNKVAGCSVHDSMPKTILHYFLETTDDLKLKLVGTSSEPDGAKAFVDFANCRYGFGGWTWKTMTVGETFRYIKCADGRCLKLSPFPPDHVLCEETAVHA
jgi:hypothetical protein